MCQRHHQTSQNADETGQPQQQHAQDPRTPSRDDDFPWHLGIHDAHCHPTDTMASVASLPTMRAQTLVIMATRSQDQHLVAQVAKEHSVGKTSSSISSSSSSLNSGNHRGCKVVPSFGWHPWFSHQLFDDSAPEPTYKPPNSSDTSESSSTKEEQEQEEAAAKAAHYQAVLSPPPQDPAFLASLPVPTPLSSFINATHTHLTSFPSALVGEVGLDKAFRLPQQWGPPISADTDANSAADSAASRPPPPLLLLHKGLTPGGREGRLLSPHRVRMQHQQVILTAQLKLAGLAGRAVSVHGVQAHGVLYDTVSALWKGHERKVLSRRERKMVAPSAESNSDEDSSASDLDDVVVAGSSNNELPQKKKPKQPVAGKPFPPRICLHSYSGSIAMLQQWLHPSVPSRVFVSFSTAINLGTDAGKAKLADIVRAVPDDRLLVESDLHKAGEDMETRLEDIYRLVCQIKGWDLESGIQRIGRNFHQFIHG